MFKIGDIVLHKTTGRIGKIVGYGHRLGDRIYFTTLKVELLKSDYLWQPTIEDKIDKWRFVRLNYLPLINPDLERSRLVA